MLVSRSNVMRLSLPPFSRVLHQGLFDFITAQLVMLPVEVDGDWELKLVWQVESETFSPQAAGLLYRCSRQRASSRYNQVRFR